MKAKLTEAQRAAAQAKADRYNAVQKALGRSCRVKFNGEQFRLAWRGRSSWHSGREIAQFTRNLEKQLRSQEVGHG